MYFEAENGQLVATVLPPAGAAPIAAVAHLLLPPQIEALHRRFRGWGEAGMSPGAVTPARTWCGDDNRLFFRFDDGHSPLPLTHVRLARELAAWLVMLDQWLETDVIMARARNVWSTGELAAALSFMTPVFLPSALQTVDAHHWERVALALARIVAAGPQRNAAAQAEQPGAGTGAQP